MKLPDQNIIQEKCLKIENLLYSYRVSEAISEIKEMAQWINFTRSIDEMESSETTYSYILDYLVEGYEDKEREKHYLHLIQGVLHWFDLTKDRLLTNVSNDLLYSRKRLLVENYIRTSGKEFDNYLEDTIIKIEDINNQRTLFSDEMIDPVELSNSIDELNREYDESLSTLFEIIWCAVRIKRFKQTYEELVTNDKISSDIRLITISALTLSLTLNFEEDKLSAILSGCKSSTVEVRERSLIGLIITRKYHAKRLSFYPELENRIKELLEEDFICKEIKQIIVSCEYCRNTDNINKYMSEVIFPSIMKKIKEIDNDPESEKLDKHPKWMDNVGEISDKIEIVGKLEQNGYDIFYSSFSHLKSYAFFTRLSNWFLPFNPNNSFIRRAFKLTDKQMSPVLNIVMRSDSLCNSDKYSLTLSMEKMPDSSRKELIKTFYNFNPEDETTFKPKARDPLTVTQRYIQDCYRFFTLNMNWNRAINPIRDGVFNLNDPLFAPLYNDQSFLSLLMNYYIDVNKFDEALYVIQRLIGIDNRSAMLYQKLGYCLEQLERNIEAIDAYLKGEILQPNDNWTIKRIASLYDELGDYEAADSYYQRALELSPNNKQTLLRIAAFYIRQERYSESIGFFYKVYFMDESNIKALRGIAWCSIMLKKNEDGERILSKIIAESDNASDWLNAGHIACLNNNMKLAVQRYKKAYELLEFNIDKMYEFLEQDRYFLIKAGMNSELINKLPDLVRLSIK
ncbi:MAG: tetratricopeptide repeat protein [Bacteroidales bacterium]